MSQVANLCLNFSKGVRVQGLGFRAFEGIISLGFEGMGLPGQFPARYACSYFGPNPCIRCICKACTTVREGVQGCGIQTRILWLNSELKVIGENPPPNPC